MRHKLRKLDGKGLIQFVSPCENNANETEEALHKSHGFKLQENICGFCYKGTAEEI